jgi:hypothetical protein
MIIKIHYRPYYGSHRYCGGDRGVCALKKRGANYVGLSPFVNERTPSFTVSPAKGIFKDFSSGKGGSAVTFLMELEKFTYPEALNGWPKNTASR